MITTREGLLPIGKFAHASRLSPKALRLYDQKGIITPAYVDPESGYRYYRRDQLPQARLVRLLRQMEMPLAIIQLAVGREPDEVEELVRAYSRTYAARVGRVQSTIRQVLEMLRDKEVAMAFEVEITELDPQQIVRIPIKSSK